MDLNQAKAFIEGRVEVTRQKVAVSKSFILKNFEPGMDQLFSKFINSFSITILKKIPIHTINEDDLVKIADGLSWQLAFCEAVWGLISSGICIPREFAQTRLIKSLEYDDGRYAGGLSDLGTEMEVPSRLTLLYSQRNQKFFTDGDLFLQGLGIPSLHKAVEESLRESIGCFRHELFLASAVMLGRALEGTWIETGLSLSTAIESTNRPAADKLRALLVDPFVGAATKMKKVLDTYRSMDLPRILNLSIKTAEMESLYIWSDVVRRARNEIHYGVTTGGGDPYEKVAALLLGTGPNLRQLYKIIDEAKTP